MNEGSGRAHWQIGFDWVQIGLGLALRIAPAIEIIETIGFVS
jgi:hypothetical protein